MKLSDYKHVHCIGIGGIGISAIARYCKSRGASVQGSDGGVSRITLDLQNEGIIVYNGHNGAHISKDADLVIYTIAIRDDNEELKAAQERGIKCLTYPQALGLLTEEYTTIAVCGTHGKTTTTAMVATMFKLSGKSPTVIVGSLLSEGGSNFLEGDSEYLIVEACEYKRSFLNLRPTHILVTNIDEDHLDYYKDMNDIRSAFQSFADTLPESGSLITHGDVDLKTKAKKINADIIEKNKINLTVLGEHNKENAQLALTLAQELGLDDELARKGLEMFSGTWRRLEYRGTHKGGIFYDDYGHHPTEIKATLQALRERYPEGKYKLIALFQPHLYSRTKQLLNDFSQSFEQADKALIMPIYASREKDDGTVSSYDLVEKTPNGMYVETFEEAYSFLDKNAHSGTVVVTMGAGDVYRVHDLFPKE